MCWTVFCVSLDSTSARRSRCIEPVLSRRAVREVSGGSCLIRSLLGSEHSHCGVSGGDITRSHALCDHLRGTGQRLNGGDALALCGCALKSNRGNELRVLRIEIGAVYDQLLCGGRIILSCIAHGSLLLE